MTTTLLTPSELLEIQRRFYGELRKRAIAITYVTVSDGVEPCLEVGVEEDGLQHLIPGEYEGVRVRTRPARRAVLAIGDREALLG